MKQLLRPVLMMIFLCSDDANSKGAANNDALRAALPGRLGRAFPVREV